ncbi:MAG: ATP-binding protein [Magnetococcus sp. YQC-5]
MPTTLFCCGAPSKKVDILASSIVEARPEKMLLIVRDDGLGMNTDNLENYLSRIGKSGTQAEGINLEAVIGQFGIGFLSACQ